MVGERNDLFGERKAGVWEPPRGTLQGEEGFEGVAEGDEVVRGDGNARDCNRHVPCPDETVSLCTVCQRRGTVRDGGIRIPGCGAVTVELARDEDRIAARGVDSDNLIRVSSYNSDENLDALNIRRGALPAYQTLRLTSATLNCTYE